MANEEELRIIATASTEDAEQKLRQLAGAKDEVKDAAAGAAGEVKELEDATKNATASEGDFVAILSRVNPALGALADVAFKGTKIVGELATENINVAKLTEKAKEAVTEFSGALQLIGAGGGALASIFLVIEAFREMAAEADRVAAAVQGITDAINEQKAAALDLRTQAAAAAAGRPEAGPATPEELEAAAQAAERIGRRFPGLQSTAAGQAGLLAGVGLSFEEQTQAAELGAAGRLTITPTLSRQGIANEVRAQLRANEAEIAQGLQTRGGLGAGVAGEAARELRGDGATFSIQEFARRLPGQAFQGGDLDRIARLAQLIAGGATPYDVSAADLPIGGGNLLGKAVADALQPGGGGGFFQLEKLVEVAAREGIEGATPAEVRQAEFLARQIRRAAPVTINAQNGRYFNNGQAARNQATKTGERRRRVVDLTIRPKI